MGSRWREPTFIAEVKSRVSTDQFTRFSKMYHEPFFLLDCHNPTFKVSGSTKSEYFVTVQPNGSMKCTCSALW